MANYSDDADLLLIRSGLSSYGSDWTTYHTEAKSVIDRYLEAKWFRPESTERGYDYETAPFDSDNLRAAQLTNLSAYKTLELIYRFLMKDTPEPDGFKQQMLFFRDEYDRELEALLHLGIDYDWDEDDSFAEDERITPVIRRLRRR